MKTISSNNLTIDQNNQDTNYTKDNDKDKDKDKNIKKNKADIQIKTDTEIKKSKPKKKKKFKSLMDSIIKKEPSNNDKYIETIKRNTGGGVFSKMEKI